MREQRDAVGGPGDSDLEHTTVTGRDRPRLQISIRPRGKRIRRAGRPICYGGLFTQRPFTPGRMEQAPSRCVRDCTQPRTRLTKPRPKVGDVGVPHLRFKALDARPEPFVDCVGSTVLFGRCLWVASAAGHQREAELCVGEHPEVSVTTSRARQLVEPGPSLGRGAVEIRREAQIAQTQRLSTLIADFPEDVHRLLEPAPGVLELADLHSQIGEVGESTASHRLVAGLLEERKAFFAVRDAFGVSDAG